MKAPAFMHGAALALIAALLGSATMFVFAGAVAGPLILRAVVTAIGLGYVLWLIARSGTRAGKVSAVVVWTILSAVALAFDAPLFLYLCLQVGMVWLLRALCMHRSVLPALIDLALCAASIAAALWAADRTGSVFLTIWCLLLVQAAWVLIPRRGGVCGAAAASHPGSADRFAHAYRSAQGALRRLSNP